MSSACSSRNTYFFLFGLSLNFCGKTNEITINKTSNIKIAQTVDFCIEMFYCKLTAANKQIDEITIFVFCRKW